MKEETLPYYRRKSNKIIIEKKINGKSKYIRTLPDPRVLIKIFEYVESNPSLNLLRCKKIKCRKCGKSYKFLLKGLCEGCVNEIRNDSDYKKKYQIEKKYHISYETYLRIVNKCIVCGFSENVSLHHIDSDHDNNSENNLVGLCPNHHAQIHSKQYAESIRNLLQYNLQNKVKFYNEEYPLFENKIRNILTRLDYKTRKDEISD